jgi:hypothetical protein
VTGGGFPFGNVINFQAFDLTENGDSASEFCQPIPDFPYPFRGAVGVAAYVSL